MALRTASRVRSIRAATGPSATLAAADSTPGCGRVGAMVSAALTPLTSEARASVAALRRMWMNS
ncbi:hypothetical protein ACH4HG_39515 [Streptomyces coeruleorubidus]|uniref:Uncharacterized protein n=1 Tax=Streptomyces coeruleorubidus TaxID=116188 RepID=A0ABZ0KKY6_STRC4|nr:hypothetical protein [Streptomyces coeruleorubidus]WOT38281.1 hypothetical protein R5U08_30875 [Streptomyces coeruleorubidus]